MAYPQFNNRDPIYLQIIDHFRNRLVSGELSLGEELPSRREIARQLNVNPNTVQRAFSEMEAMNWLFTEPNRPSRVTADPDILKGIKQAFVEHAVREFVTSIQTIDITYDDVSKLLAAEIARQQQNNGGNPDD